METRTNLKDHHNKDYIIKEYYLIIAISSTRYTPIRVVPGCQSQFQDHPHQSPDETLHNSLSINEDSIWEIFTNIRNAVPINELFDQFTQAIRPNQVELGLNFGENTINLNDASMVQVDEEHLGQYTHYYDGEYGDNKIPL